VPKYPLTTRQKRLLRSIVPGLLNGTVRTRWLVLIEPDVDTLELVVKNISGLDDETWGENWKDKVQPADFDIFVQYGFFIRTGKQNYSLNEQMIIDAVNNDFEISEAARVLVMGDQINVGDINRSNVNISSTLDNVAQIVDGIPVPGTNQAAKDEALRLIEQLNDVLQELQSPQADGREPGS
jgi:hypothetical protein